jgi:phage baseplate assembly protein gpV
VNDASDPLIRAFAPQSRQNRDQAVHSVVTGRVVKIEEDGTYRVNLFGINGQDDDVHSAPARVMMPGAGGNRGVHIFPEPGDEVVVAFHAGDTNNPIILGGVWNRDSLPPEQAKQSARNDIRTIVSRINHELTFNDSPGGGKVTLKSQNGSAVEFDDSGQSVTITIHTPQQRRVVLDDTNGGRIQIETPTCQLTLAEPGKVDIRATASITLSAPIISLDAGSVSVGQAPGTAMIEGTPFRLHTHTGGTITPGVTGPVV